MQAKEIEHIMFMSLYVQAQSSELFMKCVRRFFHRIKAGRPILVPGSGLQVRFILSAPASSHLISPMLCMLLSFEDSAKASLRV